MKSNETILIVDDTKTNIDILVDLLETYDVLVATSGEDALKAVAEDAVDLILLDIMMPGMDGIEVCQRLKQRVETSAIPVIFMTASDDEQAVERAYDSGGVDYISKPFRPVELLMRVRTQLERGALIRHLTFIATHDALTGIYNRRRFFELAEQKFAQTEEELFAAMIDIDHFKSINDCHGHAVGDQVLQELTRTISAYLTERSVFGRLGGEEFAVVSELPSESEMIERLETIRKAVASMKVESELGTPVTFTISAGIAKKRPDIQTIDALLSEADKALYKAKGEGRNRTIVRQAEGKLF